MYYQLSLPLFRLGTLTFDLRFASCNFLPNKSSFATKKKSVSNPNTCNTNKYEPILTLGVPFFIAVSVGLLIFARFATCLALSFLLNRASFIFFPNSVRILFICKIIIFF